MYHNSMLQGSPGQKQQDDPRDINQASTLPPPQTLQPSFNPSLPSTNPSQNTLPSLQASLFARDPPVSKYYDPTQDSGDSAMSRNTHYDRYPADAREQPRYPDLRNPAPSSSYDHSYQQSPNTAPTYTRPSPIHPPPGPIQYHPPRNDMPASPISPKLYSNISPHQPTYSSPIRPPSRDTPVRKDPMSLSSIITNNDPPTTFSNPSSARRPSKPLAPIQRAHTPPVPTTPTPAPAPILHLASIDKEKITNGNGVKPPAKEVNGSLQPPSRPTNHNPPMAEVAVEYHKVDKMDLETINLIEQDVWYTRYQDLSKKRAAVVAEDGENSRRKRRRQYNSIRFQELFDASAEKGKAEYLQNNESKAWREIQAQEAHEERERKKDMQRKRRREKALLAESLKREVAIERAENAVGDERERAIREIQKHEKKMRHTRKLLSGVEVKDLREVTPQTHNLEGGIMGSFQMSDDPREGKKRGGRMSTRPRKSKEQKQAEKDQAAAAQAALERGESLPLIAPKETSRFVELAEEDIHEKHARHASRYTSKAYNQLFESIWKEMAKRDIGKTIRIKNESLNTKATNLRKTAHLAGKEARRFQLRTNKSTKDVQARAKRSMREMLSFWRRNERDERDQRKMAERQELENAKRLESEREAARQRRKLNFLLSQTELYSHFIEKKVRTSELENSTNDVDVPADNPPPPSAVKDLPDIPSKPGRKVTNFEDLDFDNEDETELREAAMANAANALKEAQDRTLAFKDEDEEDGELNFQNPTSMGEVNITQPKMLTAQLKEYQLKGLNWLVNLYEQGINGILADEMGLGKTVQSISVMAHLAETQNIWGPFLVIAPASTLHNWQQELAKFVPKLKALPYWGTAKDRKVLRKFWDRKKITYREDAPFHVLITSYQLVVQDTQYFQRMTWQYMILDEAQAIKSSSSSRWKSLLGFHCRNRLLLTGTPIQNNMQELWALLHFIMPTLFDSHDEFSEWFSKDIESHAQSNTKLNEDQLKRLHMILKPFMLRRVKKHVQKELGDKIELDVFCDLTYRQRAYYSSLRNKISLMDLIEKATIGDDQDTATLMNLVMQFRKVCNHPDLFERADTSSPFSFSSWAETASFIREGQFVNVAYSVRNMIEYKVPRLVYSKERLDRPGPTNEKAGWRGKALYHMMNIFTTEHVQNSSRTDGAFSWLRFADVSASEVFGISQKDVLQRAVDLRRRDRDLSLFSAVYEDEEDVSVTSLFNIVERNGRKPLADMCVEGRMASLLNVAASAYEQTGLSITEPCARPGASAPPVTLDCSSQHANIETENALFNVAARTALYGITPALDEDIITQKAPLSIVPRAYEMLPEANSSMARYTHITVPSMRRFVSDCGKLAQLDRLLGELKEGGHRVLLYFQMTRMIDMMEEYLTYRNYKYCRLDGSTKLEDRRDTVHDFQTRPEIFIFLLSTRAGGLGINLTSADTVIFYDSDWNPTIDSQAMDRAHRLGQTKQVTVYRLITRGTIEERIRKRALQKEEVQRVVISGQSATSTGGAVVDFNTRNRDNRTKDIALWLADDEQAEEIERREQEAIAKGEANLAKGKKRKRATGAGSIEDMYHEGEGHFEDSAKPSGAATPMEEAPPSSKRKKGMSKKAKTMKQRLAIADGEVNV